MAIRPISVALHIEANELHFWNSLKVANIVSENYVTMLDRLSRDEGVMSANRHIGR